MRGLVPADARRGPGASGRDRAREVQEVLGRGRGGAGYAEHEVEVRGRGQQALVEERVRGGEHPVVEDLELGRRPVLADALEDRADRRQRVLEDAVAEVAGPERQRGHLGPEREGRDPLLDGHADGAARRELLDDRASRADGRGVGPKRLEILGRGPVRLAAVDVADRSSRVVRTPVLLADLVGRERQMRLLRAGDLGAHAGHGDHDRVADARHFFVCFWRSSGTTQVPFARTTTTGGSSRRAELSASPPGAMTLRASNRICREVRPLPVSSASTSR